MSYNPYMHMDTGQAGFACSASTTHNAQYHNYDESAKYNLAPATIHAASKQVTNYQQPSDIFISGHLIIGEWTPRKVLDVSPHTTSFTIYTVPAPSPTKLWLLGNGQ